MSEANTILSNFFVLKELKLLKTNLSTGELELESVSEANQCPHCQNITKIKYDKRIVIIRDCPLRHGQHPIYLKIHKKRFWCSGCKKVFTEKLPGIIPRRRTTERFQRQIMFACDRYAHLNQVRKDFFVSSDFVYRAFYVEFPQRGPG